MRYALVDDIEFADAAGGMYTLKDFLEPQPGETVAVFDLAWESRPSFLDAVAVAFYGDNSETEWWRIFDHNAAKIVERNCDLTKIARLDIPA